METEIHVPIGSPFIRKFPIFVDEHRVTEGAIGLIKELRPAWDTERVRTKLFTDGTTNKLVGCYVEDSPEDVVLVRVYGNKTELIVDRDNELKSFQVLHANGCAPRLYCTFQNGICYEFIQGDALGTQDVRDPPNLWIKMRKYFSLVATEFTEQASNLRIQREVPSQAVLEHEMLWMKEHLSALGSPVYSSYNYQAFDIGNHFNEFAGMSELDYGLYPSREMQLEWLQASHFFWGFWALIQAKYSSIDFDFLGYAVLRFNQYFKTKPAVMALKIPE
ncbi:hypothetical protein CRUP_027583 [Coryphaenoides rupestris]|nr:hypothetical protein CRUP_027583 [Coryphaenoides rupestris]